MEKSLLIQFLGENPIFKIVDTLMDNKGLELTKKDIIEQLKDKVEGEVALNIVSGTGKEHMALLSALLKLGLGIRFIALTKDGVEEI